MSRQTLDSVQAKNSDFDKNRENELQLCLKNGQAKVNNANKIELTTNMDKESKIDSKISQKISTDSSKVCMTKNEGNELIISQNIQEHILSCVSKVEETINKDKDLQLHSQHLQKTIIDTNEIEEKNKNKELKQISLTIQEKIAYGTTSDIITNENKNLKLLTKNIQKKLTGVDVVETAKIKDKELQFLLQDKQEKISDGATVGVIIDKEEKPLPSSKHVKEKDMTIYDIGAYGNESKKNVLLRNNKANDKFLILIKNIPKSLHNIKENVKQIISTNVKKYKNKRKEIKQRIKLEKEILKKIPKRGQESLYERKISDEQEWFKNQYERYIGLTKVIKEVNPIFALRCLRMKAYCRYVPEAKELWRKSKPKPKDSVFLTWNGPSIPTCTCPYTECFCRGDMILEPKRIPCGGRYDWNPLYYLQMLCCYRKFTPTPRTKEFINKLVTMTSAEENRYQTLYKKGLLNQMAPELCLLQCLHYRTRGHKRTIKYFTELKKPDDVPEENENFVMKTDEPIEEHEEYQICNTYSCTVSSQTDTGPNGKIIVGKVSHFIFASIKDSVLSDIEGKKLHISPYERHYKAPDNQVCVRKMENLFNIKQIRSRISKLISSIIEIKEPGVPLNSRAIRFPSCSKFCEDNARYKRCYNIESGSAKNNKSSIKDINKHSDIEDL